MGTNELGAYGERLCASFLKRHGWNILEQNLNDGLGEVDIICERQGCLLAVEVKTRTVRDDDRITGIVTKTQRNRLARAISSYARTRATLHTRVDLYLAIIIIQELSIRFFRL